MDRCNHTTPVDPIIFGALELSKNSWLLGLQFPDRPQPSCIRSEAGIRKG